MTTVPLTTGAGLSLAGLGSACRQGVWRLTPVERYPSTDVVVSKLCSFSPTPDRMMTEREKQWGRLFQRFELSLTLCHPDRKGGPAYRKRAGRSADR